MLVEHGFAYRSGSTFERPSGDLIHAVWFQLTKHGDGKFCCNVGVNVPGLDSLWGREESSHLLLASRLSEAGVDGRDCWLRGDDAETIAGSFAEFASYLPLADPWLARFSSYRDVVSHYGVEKGFDAWNLGDIENRQQYAAIEYAFLQMLAGDRDAALLWLEAARRAIRKPTYGMHRKKMRRLPIDDDDQANLKLVERQILRIRSS